MRRGSYHIAGCTLAAALAWPAAGAQAQYYGAAPQGAPLYPYATQTRQPYAVEVAPGTYVIQRPEQPRADRAMREERAERVSKRVTRNDPKLIEELRQRHAGKRDPRADKVVNTRQIVHDKPVVIEHTRVVDDPPRVIVRKRYVDDTPTASIPRRKQVAVEREPLKPDALRSEDGKKRVIEADAEVTIIGPDRMSIRLFRKRRGAEAKASVE